MEMRFIYSMKVKAVGVVTYFLDMGYSKTYTQVLKGVISNLIGVQSR